MPEYSYLDSNEYGGKEGPVWSKDGFTFPGYHNAYIGVTYKKNGAKAFDFTFLISPSSFADSRQKLFQTMRTMAGWMIVRLGRQPIELNLTGYMVDIKGTLERHDFLENYNKYIEDQKNFDASYFSEYNTKLVIEGREYYGILTGVSFSKVADRPFLYSYNLGFIALGEVKVYNPKYAAQDAADLRQQVLKGSYNPGYTMAGKVAEELGITASNTESFAVTIQEIINSNNVETKTHFSATEQGIYNLANVNKSAANNIEAALQYIETEGSFSVSFTNGDSAFVNVGGMSSYSSVKVTLPAFIISTLNKIKSKIAVIKSYDSQKSKLWTNASAQSRDKIMIELYEMMLDFQSSLNNFEKQEKGRDNWDQISSIVSVLKSKTKKMVDKTYDDVHEYSSAPRPPILTWAGKYWSPKHSNYNMTSIEEILKDIINSTSANA